MNKYITILVFLLSFNFSWSQAKVDLDRSVPLWMQYDSTNNAILKWLPDDNAAEYIVSEASANQNLTLLETLDGSATSYSLGQLNKGVKYDYHIRKDISGRGIISVGLELPVVHKRGRCLLAVDNILIDSLDTEIAQLIGDISMDGWTVDTLHILQNESVPAVKNKIIAWYDEEYDASQSLFLLGHIPVPYSGNSAHDGHTNHQGAWAADVFYGEMNGFWTDNQVNNTTPSRDVNKNIPGDGKYDQTSIPSNLELEVGRVDFHNLPSFPDSEIELTRQYLNKNHDFKIGQKDYPRRALIENNFSSFPEGFGQGAWRNFPTMFGGENVSIQNYDVVLETEKYLFSFACGGGSYTSCSGIGTTSNLWVAKDIQTVFTLNFGSYFGDWDSQNNFLRSALASGDVLANAWSGRPTWQLYDMALGGHIGYSAMLTQNATGSFFNQGNSPRSAHIALMGDPTLRLHPVKPVETLTSIFSDGNIILNWTGNPDASHGYAIYRREEDSDWELLKEFESAESFTDLCVKSNTRYDYAVKAIKLESSGSGSYFNMSLGISNTILSGDNSDLITYYADVDMDGFGDPDNTTESCSLPSGFSENNLDCDDANININPNATEITNNGIDEDCDGMDLSVGVEDLEILDIEVFPNPTSGLITVKGEKLDGLQFRLYNVNGEVVKSGSLERSIDLTGEMDGLYWLEVRSGGFGVGFSQMVVLVR